MTIQQHPDFNDLVAWIEDNIRAGCTRDSLLQAGIESGHASELVVAALAKAYNDPKPANVPWPNLDKPWVWAGDRVVRAALTLQNPKFVLFNGFCSEAETEELIELARPKFQRSTGLNAMTGEFEVHPARTSDGMHFKAGESQLVAKLDARIAELVNWPTEKSEGLQVLRYSAGGEYIPHNDYFDPDFSGNAEIISRGGNRVGTFIIYLQEPEMGGETYFPDVGMTIVPKKGSAIFFAYDKPDVSTLTTHAGLPVIKGEKIIATKWFREHNFE